MPPLPELLCMLMRPSRPPRYGNPGLQRCMAKEMFTSRDLAHAVALLHGPCHACLLGWRFVSYECTYCGLWHNGHELPLARFLSPSSS